MNRSPSIEFSDVGQLKSYLIKARCLSPQDTVVRNLTLPFGTVIPNLFTSSRSPLIFESINLPLVSFQIQTWQSGLRSLRSAPHKSGSSTLRIALLYLGLKISIKINSTIWSKVQGWNVLCGRMKMEKPKLGLFIEQLL